MAGDLEAGHGSVEGSAIHELFLAGEVPPKKKGKTQSAHTVQILQKYSNIMRELGELEKMVNGHLRVLVHQ